MTKAAQAYTPNARDPRVHNRIKKAFGFACGVLSHDKSHGWSTRYIDRYFGQQQNPLSQWLRGQLLICTNDLYNKDAGITKQYRLNETGANYIRYLLKGGSGTVQDYAEQFPAQDLDVLIATDQHQFDEQCVAQWVSREYAHELESGEFNYDDKSHRLWHPLQSVKRMYKKPILAQHGFQYHYDIQCAAPTLIHQHAQRQQDPMDLYLFALRRYLEDRTHIRKQIAQAMEIDVRTAKVIVNALFSGARIGNNPDFALSQLLGNDPAKIQFLKEDPYITELRADIKTCWTYITPSMTRRSILDKNNKTRMLPISSREKWMRYFDLERTVLNAVIDYMKSHNMKYFLEHDGWACSQAIDLTQLSQCIFERTGYQVEFECVRVSNQNDVRDSLRELVE